MLIAGAGIAQDRLTKRNRAKETPLVDQGERQYREKSKIGHDMCDHARPPKVKSRNGTNPT